MFVCGSLSVEPQDGLWLIFMKASAEGHITCVELLLAAGANPKTKASDGKTPIGVLMFISPSTLNPLPLTFANSHLQMLPIRQ